MAASPLVSRPSVRCSSVPTPWSNKAQAILLRGYFPSRPCVVVLVGTRLVPSKIPDAGAAGLFPDGYMHDFNQPDTRNRAATLAGPGMPLSWHVATRVVSPLRTVAPSGRSSRPLESEATLGLRGFCARVQVAALHGKPNMTPPVGHVIHGGAGRNLDRRNQI